MNNTISKIDKNLSSLPSKDVAIGRRFLEKRDFYSLKELVDSAIIRTIRGLKVENPKEEYIKVDLELLNILKSQVDIYVIELEILDEQEPYDYE